jgi:hypothetical protein
MIIHTLCMIDIIEIFYLSMLTGNNIFPFLSFINIQFFNLELLDQLRSNSMATWKEILLVICVLIFPPLLCVLPKRTVWSILAPFYDAYVNAIGVEEELNVYRNRFVPMVDGNTLDLAVGTVILCILY